jgi:hypothetical protein
VLDLFDGRQELRVDLMEAAAEPGESPDVGVDGRSAQILEEVIVNVDPVEAGVTR